MPPTEPKIVGDNTAAYKWGITSTTVVAFMNLDSIEESANAEKHEIVDGRGNTILQAFSKMGQNAYALSGQYKGAVKPLVGDVLDLQPLDEGAAIKVVLQEDLKIGESNSGWRTISTTAIHFPDMVHA